MQLSDITTNRSRFKQALFNFPTQQSNQQTHCSFCTAVNISFPCENAAKIFNCFGLAHTKKAGHKIFTNQLP